jgi:hypothetical protein
MSAVTTEEIQQSSLAPRVDVGLRTAAIAAGLRPVLAKTAALSHETAAAIASLLSPAAAAALGLGLWRIGADLGWTGQFVISTGVFSHWQVWIVLAVVLEVLSSTTLRSNYKTEPRNHS